MFFKHVVAFGTHFFTVFGEPINRRVDDHKMAAGAKATPQFIQCSPVIGRVMNGSIENSQIETRCPERQMVKFRFHQRRRVAVASGSAQTIHGISKDVERYRMVIAQSKPIRHPAVPRPQIQHIEFALCGLLDLRKNRTFKIAIASAANRPLRRVPAAEILIGKRAVICAFPRAPAFGRTDRPIVFEEPVSRGYCHEGFRTKINMRWSDQPRSTGHCAARRSKASSV